MNLTLQCVEFRILVNQYCTMQCGEGGNNGGRQ